MAVKVSFTIRILTVTKKLLHLENYFVDVSTVLKHKIIILSHTCAFIRAITR